MNFTVKLMLLLLFGFETTQAASPQFFIATTANSKEAEAYLGYFETQAFKELRKSFPCVEISSQSTVASLLELERQKQLLGSGSDEQLASIGAALGSNYLISLKVDLHENTVLISALCMNAVKAKTLSRAMASAIHGDAALDAVEIVSRELVDGLQAFEICPFTGPVDIAISSFRDTTETDQYPVYCNGGDDIYKKVTQIKTHTESTWNLRRKGVSWTEGTMTFYNTEKISIEETNGCYRCPSGREGGRTYYQKKSFNVKGNGISHESIHEGKPQQDTRVELVFLDDGTYLIKPKGTSLAANAEEETEISAEGTCDNLSPQTRTLQKEVTIPLNVVFGPYPGKSTDKILKQHDEMNTIDPVNGERSKAVIDFELKHD